MSRRDLIDPEALTPLTALLEVVPGGFNAIPDIVRRRATAEAMLSGIEVPDNPGVTREDRTVPGPEGDPDISVRIYRPIHAHGEIEQTLVGPSDRAVIVALDQENSLRRQPHRLACSRRSASTSP